MKKINLLIVSIALIFSSCNNENHKTPETEIERVSYSLGINVATGVKAQGLETLDINAISKAMSDVFEDNDLDISEEESMQILQDYFRKIQNEASEKLIKEQAETLEKNKKAITAANGNIITLESGLKIEILEDGQGAQAEAGKTVFVHYTGKLTDGTKFDSSHDRGQPFEFPLGQGKVIPGWDEAVQLMSVGDKWRLTIPSNLAYGDRGAPGSPIGPGATLVFEIELLKIN